MNTIKTAALIAAFGAAGLPNTALAQATPVEVTQAFEIDGSETIPFNGFTFNAKEIQVTITDAAQFIARVTASSIGPASNATVILLYQLGDFDRLNLVANLLSPISANSEVNSGTAGGPYPEGQYTVVVAANLTGDTGSFLFGLRGAFFGLGPTLQQALDDLKSSLAALTRLATQNGAGNARGGAQDSFTARDQQRFFDLTNDGTAAFVSTQNGQMMGNVYAWLEFSGYLAQSKTARKFSGSGVQVGADIGFGDNFVAGLSVGYNDLNARTPLASTSGDYTFVQPYLGYRRGDWSAQMSFSYGEADYTQTTVGGVGTADSEIWSVNLSVAKDIAVTDAVTMTPIAAFHYGEEELTGKTGTLAGAAKTTIDYSEVSLGARWSKQTMLGAQYIGLHADYVESNAPNGLTVGGFDGEGLSARVEMGTGFNLTPATRIDFGVEAGGLGSSLNEYAGQLRFTYGF